MHNFKKKPPKEHNDPHIFHQLLNRFNQSSYNLLLSEDEPSYFPIKEPELHKRLCYEMARQLAFLLSLTEQQFFEHLQIQDQLRASDSIEDTRRDKHYSKPSTHRLSQHLQSCLQTFVHPAYIIWSDQKSRQDKTQPPPEYWSLFKSIVLMVFKRISQAKTTTQKVIVLNGWYLDTCKLLDICLIYGTEYRADVLEIIRNFYTKGEKFEDFDKNFERALELSYSKLEDICQHFQGLPKLDFTQLKQNQQKYNNFLNPIVTFTISIQKLIFSINDIILNFQSLLYFFPARYKIQHLAHSLIFKRIIMIYNKIRYYEQNEWHFGHRQEYFKSLMIGVQSRIVQYLSHSMNKIAMLIRDLSKNQQYYSEIKSTYVNFCYFTALKPAVSYQFRDNTDRLNSAHFYGQELFYLVTKQNFNSIFSKQTLVNFKKGDNFYKVLRQTNIYCKNFRHTKERIESLMKLQNWKLPSFKQFEKTFASIQQHSFQNKKKISNELDPYDDEPHEQKRQLYCQFPFFDSFDQSFQIQYLKSQQSDGSTTMKFDSEKCSNPSIGITGQQLFLKELQALDYSSLNGSSEHTFIHHYDESKEQQSIDSGILSSQGA